MRLWSTVLCFSIAGLFAGEPRTLTVEGVVVDSACAFVKDLKKKVDPACALACAKGGSPLVIMADDGKLYWPISETMPAVNQNPRLIGFAGKRVAASGKVYDRDGNFGIAIDQVKAQ